MKEKLLKRKNAQKVETVHIEGAEDFPLETVGLNSDSIEKSNGSILIPVELLPFLKIHRQPLVTRKKNAEAQYRYLLRLKSKKKNSQKRRLSR